MLTWKSLLLAGAIAFAPATAFAAPKEAPAAGILADEAVFEPNDDPARGDPKERMQKEIDQAIAMIEKIFGVDQLPAIAPAQLSLARQTTTALVPAGSFERMMDNLYGKLFRGMLGEFGGTSDLLLSFKTGVESDKIAALDDPSKAAIADLFDPQRKEREEQMMAVVRPLISEALADLEVPLREGLAHAYARKFSADQLTQMNGFFATPTGTAYASEWMALQADPEVMLAVIKAVPPLAGKFIDRAPEIEGKFKKFPKEKSLKDLSDAELAKLAKLAKVDVAALKEHRDMWGDEGVEATEAEDAMTDDWSAADAAIDAAADASAEAADAFDAMGEDMEMRADDGSDAMYDPDNWSDADRAEYDRLSAQWDALGLKLSAHSDAAAARAAKAATPQK